MRHTLPHLLFITILSLTSMAVQASPMFQPLDASMTSGQAASPAPASDAPLPKSHSGEVIDSVGAGAIPTLPIEIQTENGISYLSGGISDEETEQLSQQEHLYNFRLLITGQGGEFVSGLTVVVRNEAGQALLTIQDAGPCVYAQMPAGTYQIDVTTENAATATSQIKIPATGAIRTQLRV